MLMRIVLALGLLIVVLAGGAAGWQYWQTLPGPDVHAGAPEGTDRAAVPPGPQLGIVGALAPAEAPAQKWLISPGGGLIPRDTVRVWLKQDAFVEDRSVKLALTVPLTALLEPGEVLPGQAYRQVFADIRAPKLAQDLCAPLVASFAASCAVAEARAEKDSLDAAGDTAVFGFRLVYTLRPAAGPAPDLGASVLQQDRLRLKPADLGGVAATPQAFLAGVATSAATACPKGAQHCRVTSVALRWETPEKAEANIDVGWLAPLPAGVFPAPAL